MRSRPGAATPTILKQRGAVADPAAGTRWAISPQVGGLWLPLNIAYLVMHCEEDYSATIIGVPDRSYLWVMARSPQVCESKLAALLEIAQRKGYDLGRVVRVAHQA